MKIKDIMTRDVECVTRSATLTEAARKMRRFDVGSLPVCEGGQLLGVITDRDITVRAVAEGIDPSTSFVGECMTSDAFYCFDDEDVDSAARLMEEKQVRRVPIVDREKHLVGIVALADLAVDVHENELTGEVLERISEPARPQRRSA